MKVLKFANILLKTSECLISKKGFLDTGKRDSPNINIQPYEEGVSKAVKKLQQIDPRYFVGISNINVVPAVVYGYVKSGPNQDPSNVFINAQRIKTEMKNSSEDAIVDAIAAVIAHEVGHVRSYVEGKGFVGGEAPAEAEENRIRQILSERRPKGF